jgi:hypothetical protein
VAGGDCQSAADLIVILTFRPGPKFISVVGVVLRVVGARTFLGPQCWHTKNRGERQGVYTFSRAIRAPANTKWASLLAGCVYVGDIYRMGLQPASSLLASNIKGERTFPRSPSRAQLLSSDHPGSSA